MQVETVRIMTMPEVQEVIAHWKRKRRYVANRQALIVFRLATCCGLRASEVAGLTLADLRTEGARPHVRVPKAIGKGSKARTVPLWWDQGTLDDLRSWKAEQAKRGALLAVCAQSVDAFGHRLDRRTIRRVFRRVVRVLPGREDATTHDGRHTFVSLAIAAGCSLPEVQRAAGHANVATTSIYLHCVPDNGPMRNIFGGSKP